MSIKPGMVLEGKYEIQKQIGKGGMSIVYLAMDNRLNKLWAVKEIAKKGKDRYNEEVTNKILYRDAEMMKSLDHPAIPTIVDIIDREEYDSIYIVMDYVEGESLDKVIKEYGAQPQEMVVDWAKQICDALGYLHRQKPPIIYRDLKPANIMLKPDGNIKIIDFGIAREYKEQNLADTEVMGTRGYAPDEQHKGHTVIQSDIYAFGMTLHHLLTGVDPRPADYQYAPIRQWNPELSDGLERLIDKCTANKIENRYQNCDELMYALEHYEDDEAEFKKKQKRKLLYFILSITIAVVFAILGLVTSNMAKTAESNNYDNLIEINNLDYSVANENITKAIAINNKDSRAYENFLNYIIADDNITEQESQGISAFLNTLKGSYPNETYDETFAKLYYEAGINHFFYYDIATENTPTRERALKAIKYFEVIKDGGFAESEMATHFYNICKFYKSDVGNSVESRDYVSEYKSVFDSISKCIEYLDTYKESNANFVKAAMYKSTIDFIHSNIADIAKYSETDKDTLISLLDTIEQKADDINEIENEKSRAYQTKMYVLNKVPEYKQQVEDQYKNLSR